MGNTKGIQKMSINVSCTTYNFTYKLQLYNLKHTCTSYIYFPLAQIFVSYTKADDNVGFDRIISYLVHQKIATHNYFDISTAVFAHSILI